MSPEDVAARLDLAPHPEGGWYRETWRGDPGPDGRPRGTAIYYLLAGGPGSAWHRIDAVEVWHWYAGAPLEHWISDGAGDGERILLGPDLLAGARPQRVVPAGAWQRAASTGAWSLAGCTVSPGFEFTGFELAPPGWSPAARDVRPD